MESNKICSKCKQVLLIEVNYSLNKKGNYYMCCNKCLDLAMRYRINNKNVKYREDNNHRKKCIIENNDKSKVLLIF